MENVKYYIDLSYKSLRLSLDLQPFLNTVEQKIEEACKAGSFFVDVGTIHTPIIVIRQVCIILIEKGFEVKDNSICTTNRSELSVGGCISIKWNPLTDKVKYF